MKCFIQIDPDTNQVIYVPTPVIGKNLAVLVTERVERETGGIAPAQKDGLICLVWGGSPPPFSGTSGRRPS